MPRKPPLRRRKTQGGHVFLTSALVFLPLMAILLAIIDWSMSIFVISNLQQAVREGARYAVTYQTMSGMCQEASIRQVVKNASVGFLRDEHDSRIKITFHKLPNLDEASTGVGSNGPGRVVIVSVEGYQYPWLGPVLRSNDPLQITVRSASMTESLPSGSTAPPCR